MARLLVRASSNRYTAADTLGISDYPFSIVGRLRLTSKPAAADMTIAGVFKASGGGNHVGHYVAYTNSGSQDSLAAASTASSDWTFAEIAGVPAIGTWFSFVATWENATDRQIHLGGVGSDQDLTSRAFGAPTQFVVGGYVGTGGSFSAHFDGDIADFAIINKTLSEDERNAYLDGFTVAAIVPASQIIEQYDFFGHITNEPGVKAHTLTPNGTPAQSAHGGAYYYPIPQQMGWLDLRQGGGGGGGGGGQGGGGGNGNGGGNGGGNGNGGGPPGGGGGGPPGQVRRTIIGQRRRRRSGLVGIF